MGLASNQQHLFSPSSSNVQDYVMSLNYSNLIVLAVPKRVGSGDEWEAIALAKAYDSHVHTDGIFKQKKVACSWYTKIN